MYLDIKQKIRDGEEYENFLCNFNFLFSKYKRYPFLHKMDNLEIDYKLRNVSYCTKENDVRPILSKVFGGVQKFFLINEDFEKFDEIIKKREARNTVIHAEELLQLENERDKQEIIEKFERLQQDQNTSTELLTRFLKGFKDTQ